MTENEGFGIVKEFVCTAVPSESDHRTSRTPIANITEPAILIRLVKRPRRGMKEPELLNETELYDATRSAWKIGRRRDAASFAFAVSKGTVLEVYRILKWRRKAGSDRYEFEGEPAMKIRARYVGKNVGHYFKPGLRAPFIYVNVPD